jgi:enoyl-CoA hydratase/carnithine racemase
MSSTFVLARMTLLWQDASMAESYATQFARKGGHARAKKLTAEQRRASARKAAQARWAKKMDTLVNEISEGTKKLLKTAKANARATRARKARQKVER